MYTVIKIMNCLCQGGLKGYELEEIVINAGLYKYFAANRFAPLMPVEEDEAVGELELEEELLN